MQTSIEIGIRRLKWLAVRSIDFVCETQQPRNFHLWMNQKNQEMKATTSKKQCPNLLVLHKKSRVTFQGLCDHVHLEFNVGLCVGIYRVS